MKVSIVEGGGAVRKVVDRGWRRKSGGCEEGVHTVLLTWRVRGGRVAGGRVARGKVARGRMTRGRVARGGVATGRGWRAASGAVRC